MDPIYVCGGEQWQKEFARTCYLYGEEPAASSLNGNHMGFLTDRWNPKRGEEVEVCFVSA